MRQRLRRILVFIALMLFPVTLNYFSPYVSVAGAFQGIVAGSVLLFLAQFASGLVLGRAWCGWLCPIAGLSEAALAINRRAVPARRLRRFRYTIFAVWLTALLTGFVLAGGIHSVNPFHMTERLVSVDEPFKYITLYLVIGVFFALTIWLGRRGACHAICWMSPFLVAGTWLGRQLRLPQLHIAATPSACIPCKSCDSHCPMSIPVSDAVPTGVVRSFDCIGCGACVDNCPHVALHFRWRWCR